MEEKIERFIQKRFPDEEGWLTGNCYFFAVILKSVFGGDIVYDVVKGHFMVKIGEVCYDWAGRVEEYGLIVKWDDFKEYDELQMKRIIRDCIL